MLVTDVTDVTDYFYFYIGGSIFTDTPMLKRSVTSVTSVTNFLYLFFHNERFIRKNSRIFASS